MNEQRETSIEKKETKSKERVSVIGKHASLCKHRTASSVRGDFGVIDACLCAKSFVHSLLRHKYIGVSYICTTRLKNVFVGGVCTTGDIKQGRGEQCLSLACFSLIKYLYF